MIKRQFQSYTSPLKTPLKRQLNTRIYIQENHIMSRLDYMPLPLSADRIITVLKIICSMFSNKDNCFTVDRMRDDVKDIYRQTFRCSKSGVRLKDDNETQELFFFCEYPIKGN